MSISIIFGRGEIGVHTNRTTILFSKLPKSLAVGHITKATGKTLVKMQFENLDSLNVVLRAIEHCKTVLELQEKIPLELRFGA